MIPADMNGVRCKTCGWTRQVPGEGTSDSPARFNEVGKSHLLMSPTCTGYDMPVDARNFPMALLDDVAVGAAWFAGYFAGVEDGKKVVLAAVTAALRGHG